jgi:hypothetical protein
MSFRFYRRRVKFPHGLPLSPPISQADAAELVRRGDPESIDELIRRHIWLAVDIAGRALAKLDLPGHLGEELASQGLLALGKAVRCLSQGQRALWVE